MKKRVHCRFEEELLEEVDCAAELLGLTRTAFIKLACRKLLRSMRTNRKSLKADI
jgi:metal-responsive CopG/Arc/MetJ family transcriptional regulator